MHSRRLPAIRPTRAIAGGLLAAVALAAPVSAAPVDASINNYAIDTDTVSLVSSDGSVNGTVKFFHSGGTIQGQVLGVAKRVSGADSACVFAVADWFYADGTHLQDNAVYSTSASGDREKACSDGVSERSFDLHSLPGKDVVKVKVYLRHAADTQSGGTTIKQEEELVGDAPQSLGTIERLDADTTDLLVGGQTVYDATNGWKLTNSLTEAGAFDIRSRLTGTLAFRDAMPGTSVTLKVRWTYEDGTTSTPAPVTVLRGDTPRTFTIQSQRKDALHARVQVLDDDGNVRAERTTLFGDA